MTRRTGPRWPAVFATAVWLLSSCGGGSDVGEAGGAAPPQAPTAGFELRLATTSVPLMQGANGLLRIGIERRGGFNGAIELKLANPPAGVSGGTVIAEDGEVEVRLPLRFGSDVPPGTLSIDVNATSGAIAARGKVQLDVQAALPGSQQLIGAARDAGQIDLGTSLLFRAYAVFGSSKLPREFVGSGPDEEDLALFADIEGERPNLPQSILDQLQPFLLRPTDPSSVFNAGQPTSRKQILRDHPMAVEPFADRCPGGAREWISQRSTQHPVRAFALCLGTPVDDLRARNELLKVIAAVDKAYGLMVANMGPAKPDLWGDDAIDVYVVPESADAPRELGDYVVERVRGVAVQQPPFVGPTSSGYVMLPRSRLAQPDYFFTVIHELFHVLQFAHNYRIGRHWFTEASASWASIHFNRTANIDPPANRDLHDERFGSFQASPMGLLSVEGDNEYFSYAWPLFMEQEGGAARIGGAWLALGSATNDDEATDMVDGMLPFEANFRKFALRNLNEPFGPRDPLPRAKRYVSLDPPFFPDGLLLPKDGVKSKSHDVAPGAGQRLNFGRAIEPLSAVYFKLSVTDATLKKVVLDLSGLQGGGLDVDALVLIDGEWEAEPRNLNGKSELTFCLDDPKEALGQMVLVVSNHQKRAGSRASAEIGVTGETTPCDTVWEGSTSFEVRDAGFESTVTASVVFEYDDSVPTPHQPFRLRSGNWTYNVKSQVPPSCQITFKGIGTMGRPPLDPRVPGSTHAYLDLFPSPSPGSYRASGSTAIEYTETDCRGNETTGQTVIGWLNVDGPGEFFISDDGSTLEGAQDASIGTSSVRHRWKLVRARR
ncbi:MAG: hypothetical protein ABI699_08110 [Caldimonas sp.]